MKIRSRGDYIFITAWNEWGEGAYLEPDEQNCYNYLKACRWAVRGSGKKWHRMKLISHIGARKHL